MKLNLGCGFNKLDSFVNVDKDPACEPDRVFDLEVFPWPFPDEAATEIELSHVLEHLGSTPKIYLAIIKELYRISKPNGRIRILVPHPRHDSFLADPTHVRPILAQSFQLFNKALNREWLATGKSNTPLALQLDVDFEIVRVNHELEQHWTDRIQAGTITEAELETEIGMYGNVVKQTTIELQVIKPGR